MTKPRHSRARYEVFSFTVKTTFPHDNVLAVDLVRLMAAYNDMSEIIEWISAHASATTKPVAIRKSRLRMGIQHRLMLALMNEALEVFRELQSSQEFKATVHRLGPKGKAALHQLRLSSGKETAPVRSRLSLGRKKVTFHYDRDSFREGLRRFPRIFLEGERAESEMLLRHNSRAYYMLPEHVRDIVAYEYKTMEDVANVSHHLRTFLAEVFRLQGELFTFMDELLKADAEQRGLADSFKHTVIYE